MGNQDEQFCLKWNDFQQCIKSTFQDLRDDDDFMDVTLSCEGEQIKAHKVILSACSITFKNLLKKNPSQNPVILLWDMSPRDLSAILDFMYNGEVNVKQEHLNSFLSVAEKLRVRGLCQSDTKPTKDKEPPKIKSRTSSSIAAPSPKEQHVSESPPVKRAKYEADNDDIQEIPATPQVKTEAGFSAVVETPQPVQLAGEAFTEEYTEGEGDYGEYYDDEGSYGVDPVDQSQAGKGLRVRSPPILVPRPGLGHIDPSELSLSPLSPRDSLRQRTVFSQQQILELEKEFRFSNFVQVDRRVLLAKTLGLSERQIKIWFQNRRMKQKREEKDGKSNFSFS